jgi:pimeloyl-ACP methyl ester carboxylesterase
MLLLHGVTRCGGDWEPVAKRLAEEWRLIALDQRGHGGSDRAASYLVADYGADAVRFLREELGVPVVVVGHSLGAMAGAAVAAEVPELVRGLVLEDPPFESMGRRIAGTAWHALFAGMQTVATRDAETEDFTTLLAALPIPQAGGGTRLLGELRSRGSLQWSAECLERVDPAVFTPLVAGRWLDGYSIPQVCGSIQCPTLLMQADPGRGGALADADALEAVHALRTCRHERFAGAGHQLHRDEPGSFLRSVADFLREAGVLNAPGRFLTQ